MGNYFFEGITLGLVLSISIGPVLFTIIEVGMTRGAKMAFCVSLGVFVSDVVIILIGHFFSELLTDFLPDLLIVKLVAAAIFLGIGLYKVFYQKTDFQKKLLNTHPLGYIQHFVKGMVINSLNPALFVFWLTMITIYEAKEPGASIWFFSGVLAITFSMDILKSIFSERINGIISVKKINKLIGFTGFVFILFGMIIIADSVGLNIKEALF